MTVTPKPQEPAPLLPPGDLDVLWFQVGGTICNLKCEHCFISCSPTNDNLGRMSLAQIEPYLEQAARLGVREYYLTGGEPFIVKELEDIIARILEQGPVSVLTNGLLITEERAARLAEIRDASRYSFELRVSLDGCTAEMNDPIRGRGTFEKALRGVERLVAVGFLPIITAAQMWEPSEDQAVLGGFVRELAARGYERPRIKILPRLKIGAEAERSEGYSDAERITQQMLDHYDPALLQCHNSRMVSDKGVHICPILVDDPRGDMGDDLEASLRPYPLEANACYTCWLYGKHLLEHVEHGGIRRSDLSDLNRVALFGGIYSNYHSLIAVVDDAKRRGCDAIYCLGDVGAFGPHPDRVFPVLVDNGIATVQGNYDHSIGNRRDDCACGYTDPRDNHFARLSYAYTFEHTADRWKDWMRDLPPELRINVGGRSVLLCHGSPRRTNEFLWESTTPDPFIRRLFREHPADLIACTHSGIHWQRRVDDHVLVNVGVIGRPENDGTTQVGYMIVESDSAAPNGLRAEYVRVDYDHATLAQEMREEGLPAEFVETIETGWWTSCLEILPVKERSCGRF